MVSAGPRDWFWFLGRWWWFATVPTACVGSVLPSVSIHTGKKSIIQYHPSLHTPHKQWQLASKVAQASSATLPATVALDSHSSPMLSPIAYPSPLTGFYVWSPSFSIQPLFTQHWKMCVSGCEWRDISTDHLCSSPSALARREMATAFSSEAVQLLSSFTVPSPRVQFPSWFLSCFPFSHPVTLGILLPF